MEKPVYIKGSAREVVFDDGGDLINFSLNKAQIAELPDKDGYVQLTMKRVKSAPDQYGNTHYIQLNTFKPKPKAKASESDTKSDESSDDLPF